MNATSLINNLAIRVPRALAGFAPVSPAAYNVTFEPESYRGLQACISPGDTVIDVGASYGLVTTMMASLAGPTGKVISIEPCQQVQSLAKTLVRSNAQIAPVQFINALVGDASRKDVEFWAVPGRMSVASTRNPEIKKFHSDCAHVLLPMVALDDLPVKDVHVIKIDVEGSEYDVVRGASRLLSTTQPHLIIETHALEIKGVSGDLQSLCALLESFGYDLWDLKTNRCTDASEFAETYRLPIGHLLASARLKSAGIEERLLEWQP